ncbi:tRNA lysidine(34) synthetase TilS [Secundilactobacillus paracollinoides]|uniref:tRNA lysidine(34) synthetase TilS n=1 Tax=Secundilactobacillus paracollinoides TaxID=240427 RepID=UPI00081A8EF8|nr:tRNA lysidine(34) synthetase TilS [Secundilactobacillus paracollinoides]ANZ59970.1 hypothetical protein AYR61_00475 [Secundilactobacillus paracollinoides]
MKFQQRFDHVIQSNAWFSKKDTVIVAVSTGVDSMTLLRLLERLPVDVRPRVIVAHVNHRLRQQSEAEAEYLRTYCHDHDLVFEGTVWPIETHPKTGIEAAARDFRYAFFGQLMRRYQATALVTAHHGDDQVETILMKLIRGGDLHQLVGIKRAQPFGGGLLVRPLLDYGKAELISFARAQHLTWYDDDTNQADDVLRNRIRHQVVPVLKQENPQLLAHVQHYADTLTAHLALSDAQLSTDCRRITVRRSPLTGDVRGFQRLPDGVQQPVMRRFLQALGPVSEAHVTAATGLLTGQRPQGEIALGNHVRLVKSYDYFSVINETELPEKPRVQNKNVVVSRQWVDIAKQWAIRLVAAPQAVMTGSDRMRVVLQPSELPLSVRNVQPSDRIQLKQGGHKLVRRIMIDHKVPNAVRDQQQVVVSAAGEVLWVIGIQRSFRAPRSDGKTFELQLKPLN